MSNHATSQSARRPRIWLVETGPLGFALAWTLAGESSAWQLIAALGGAAAASLGGLLTGAAPRIGGVIATLGLGGMLAAMAPEMVSHPLPALLVLLVAIGFVAAVWSPETLGDLVGGARRARRLRADLRDVRLAAALALAVWLISVAWRANIDPWLATASALASLMAIARAAAWMRGVLEGIARALWPGAVAIAVAAAAAAALAGAIGTALSILALVPAATLVLARARGVAIVDTGWAGLIFDHPARLIIATFLSLCAAGTLLLSLPICAAGDAAIHTIDAAFTAVSAVCVTGLITLDTPTAWSGTGQLVILILIQLGGLGIMTLSTAALGALGRRLSVRHEEAVAGLFSRQHRGMLFVALRRTLAVTFAAEIAGALVLSVLFWSHGDGFGAGLWRGAFTAVSAFCNAGFALQTDSLVGYQAAPAVLHVVALLIITGGLAPAVITALPLLARGRAVPVQVKIVLAASGALLAIGFAGFAMLEWNGLLDGMSLADRLHNAWFQSVTFRTAGFNSVDFSVLSTVTLPLACVLMFIGGAPGGTAGGVKVTTVWVLGSAVAGALRGQPEASSFGRRIPHLVVYRAIAISMISATILTAVMVFVFLTQPLSGRDAVFEVFSAIGTVGLSLGGTSDLDGLGKVVIMVAMFLGRVGPLSAFLLLVERQMVGAREQLEENVEVG